MADQKVGTGAALEYTAQQLGGPVYEIDSNPSCGTGVTELSGGGGDIVGLIIMNLGANDIYISIDANVSSTNGIKLANGGGSFALNVRDDFTLPTRRWLGISPNGASLVYVIQLFRFKGSLGNV